MQALRLLPQALKREPELKLAHLQALTRTMSAAKTSTPPPDAARGATADLCDVFLPDPVDLVSKRDVQIMEPIFQYVRVVFVDVMASTR